MTNTDIQVQDQVEPQAIHDPTDILDDEALQAIDEAEARAQAYEDQAADQAANADQAPAVDFQTMLGAVTDDQVQGLQAALATEFGERARFERDANPNNDSIQKTLTKLQGILSKPGTLRSLVATGTGAGPINRSEVTGKRRNVYAIEKMADLLYGAVTGHLKNAVNIAVFSSLVKVQNAGLPFTTEVAKAATSDKIAVDNQLKGLLIRHTVAESTASTQQSSTMTALEDLGVVANTGTRGRPVYTLLDNPLSRRLVEITKGQHGCEVTA
mgnify:CR=1 FL=1